MPNSANRNPSSNNNSKGQPKHDPENASAQKPNPERSDGAHGTDKPKGHQGDTSRSSNQGRKEASGGSFED